MATHRSHQVPVLVGKRFAVVDPATGEPFDEAPDQHPDELDAVVGRAHAAWHTWRADPGARTTALLGAADAVEVAGADLAPLLTREQGKPLAESYQEIARTAARLRYFAELTAPQSQPITDGRPVRGEVRWRPLGPVAAIIPWNFPLQLASAKFAPALAAGNTMVLKPSPFTPLATRLLGSVVAAALPDDVLTIVTGHEPLGARLASHPGIRHVTFTGSITTGQAVARGRRPHSPASPWNWAATTRRSCWRTWKWSGSRTGCSGRRSATAGRSAWPSNASTPRPGSTPTWSRPSPSARRPSSSEPA
ncbi:hypothetical protein Sfulv_59270 [Streptomyces fulvorobeus]|uniref:Aldehyde dehydrogenase domain-containing protein n=1 Tax=Streptomyces fulvorobeus TaxID=284028 RepID=A0A7J0CHC1_9ACTN|nr:hypothetical protein Sfulv_59270 [Streptomyces fulvorobeus]